MSESKEKLPQAHGITYPFDHLPETGKPVKVAEGIYWVRMVLPYTLDHINLWLLEDGDGWTLVDTCVDMDSSRAHWEDICFPALWTASR